MKQTILRKIAGEFPLNEHFNPKVASITGDFPPIEAKSLKIRGFALSNRKVSAYSQPKRALSII